MVLRPSDGHSQDMRQLIKGRGVCACADECLCMREYIAEPFD